MDTKQAAVLGQHGTVRIEIVVERSGKVRVVELRRRSGSPWLDLGAQAVFRGASVPALPPNMPDSQVTLELTIRYILMHR